jgi:ankyrin repeat protein
MQQKFSFINFQCSIQVVPSHKTFIRTIQKSQVNVIKSHLELVPDFITLTFKSHSALSIAVSNNDLTVAKLLLDNGADVNFGIPEMSRTPLHIAVFHGFLEMADLLIAHKADIRAKDNLGLNIAHHAIDANHLEAVEYCVETLGIHTETRDNNGLTLLLRAIVAKASLDIIRFLLDRKASQSVRDNNKMSILQHVRMMNDQNLVDLLTNYKPKSKTDAKQKLKHNIQKLIMSRQMKKDETDDDTADESSQAMSAFDQSSLFK